jgi:transposase
MVPQPNGHTAPQPAADPQPAANPQPTPDPEVLARPQRRRFTTEYKRRIVREAAACSEPGEIGALLRREGLYSSLLVDWRRQERLAGTGKHRGRQTAADALALENRTLKRQNERLQHRLAQAEAVIELQKKVSDLLGISLRTPESDGDD